MKHARPRQRRKAGRSISSSAVPPLSALLDALPYGVVQLDADLKIQFINAEGGRLLGLQSATFLGRPFPGIWSGAADLEVSVIQNQLSEVLKTHRPIRGSIIRLGRGTLHPVPVEWTCLPAEADGVVQLVVSLRDLSREEELQRDRGRLAAIAEENPSPMIEL